MNDPTEIRDSIKYRLQIMGFSGTRSLSEQPYTNDTNTKGRGFPLCWFMVSLVGIAIISTLYGW